MIRIVNLADSKQILDIYRYYVECDSATFDIEVPNECEIQEKIKTLSATFPYIVYEQDGCVIGYAYAHPYYGRKAYMWNVEVSVYVDKRYLHQKIGSKLYEKLLALLTKLGYNKAYACITASNTASIKMHERFEFKEIGYFKEAGYKLDAWWDVVWMEKELQKASINPQTPKSITELREL